jgi:hypothetical protein
MFKYRFLGNIPFLLLQSGMLNAKDKITLHLQYSVIRFHIRIIKLKSADILL